ncbi:MAG TPA: C39 family peptidase [Candidatus Dormibacteraeota bacterium]|nr:C39 family peptidase [Candidatus Dormibacteraeota bacterium]
MKLAAVAGIGGAAALYFAIWSGRQSKTANPRARRRLNRAYSGALATVVACAVLIGGSVGVIGLDYLNGLQAAALLPGVTDISPAPVLAEGSPTPALSPKPLPAHILLRVPFTTQAPLGNWAQHQESCEAASLTILVAYWRHDRSVIINPTAADTLIHQIDGWKTQLDLTDALLGKLAHDHFRYAYRILQNSPEVIREQLSAGRPLLAEVRTHGLGNPNYPGYSTHYEQQGWSVPHFVVIIGYDSTGVFLNDPGISEGRGYHITFAQLTHAIADLGQHHPALNQGQVLLLIAPSVPQTP